MATVKFYTGLQEKFDVLTPESNALYFVTDTRRLYKGSLLFADMSKVEEIAQKLETIPDGSGVNVLEEIKVNGSTLTIENKSVNITIETGTENGTVSVNGVDVKVKGLKDAAFKTVEELAETILSGASSGEVEDPDNPGEMIPAKPFLAIEKLETATEGFSASYQMVNKDGTRLGAVIDIPKDMVVQSGTVETVTEADTPVAGYKVGDRYIDLLLANADNTHIYILASDLVTTYEAGNGITITNNVIAVNVGGEGSGLKVDETGKLVVDTEDLMASSGEEGKPGLVTPEDKDKLDNLAVIEPGGTVGEDGERIPDGTIKIDGEPVVIYEHPKFEAAAPAFVKIGRDGEGHVVIGDALKKEDLEAIGVASTTVATPENDGLMSSSDKAALDAIKVALEWGTF